MVTKRLGKGLEALIRPYEETQAAATPVGVTDILLSKIKANPNQPRKDGLDKSSLEDLVASIKEKGVITPITVQEVDKGFMLVAGERRWRAAKLAGLKKIPVYIINVTDDAELMEMALIENIQRENLNAIEEAEAFDVLQNEFNLNHSAIAKAVGKKRVTISNSLRLLNLPAEIKASIRKGEISAGHGRAVLVMKTQATQKKLWQRILNEQLSVRAAEDIVKGKSTPKPKPKKKKIRKSSAAVRSLENELITLLGTKVRISHKKGEGVIEIEYFSDDDFERVMDLLRTIK
ncbi:MAG: ParB/RepB/Spo0J family partition protein [Candidatus Marinimicrobia bacterium]|nr:ParB/RepB/Spo0J family partition protein [Candidatus Neomarinimicrobiota bacterium]